MTTRQRKRSGATVSGTIVNDLTLRVAGDSGEGVLTTGELFARAAAFVGLNVITEPTFPAEIQGGLSSVQVRVRSGEVSYPGDRPDILIVYGEEGSAGHIEELRDGGTLLCEADANIQAPAERNLIVYRVPFREIAVKRVESPLSKNCVVLGVLSRLFDFPLAEMRRFIQVRFARKSQLILDKNLLAIDEGYAWAGEHLEKRDPFVIRPVEAPARLLMTGNEAAGLGALAGGVRCFFGYPITPSTGVAEYVARELPRLGGIMVQTEDEISAIAGVAGASYAGQKAMTATSGPGLALMGEQIGLISMAELPAVIINSQRGGPSTGLPTKYEQSDLNYAVYGSHGDAPRIVLAATNVAECFRLGVTAVNLAERYQLPVILLIDQSLSFRIQSMEKPALGKLRVDRRATEAKPGKDFERYALTDTGVSPMSVPGTPGGEYTATGLEHDPKGRPRTQDPMNHELMSAKRHMKLVAAAADPEVASLYREFPNPAARVGLIAWGSSEGAVLDAIEMAAAAGIALAAFVPRILHPLPAKALRRFVAPLEHVIVAEANYTGQLAQILRAQLGIRSIGLTKVQGSLISPAEMLQRVREAAGPWDADLREAAS